MKGITSQFLHCATLFPVPVLGGDSAGCADIVMMIRENRKFDQFNSNDFCPLYIFRHSIQDIQCDEKGL